jgi:hypothetical protein
VALVLGAEALSGILDDRQAVPGGDGIDFVHIRRLAVEADRHDGAGPGGDRDFDLAGVDIAGVRFDIDEDRRGAEQGDDFGGGDEGERGGDDFVTRLDIEGHQGNQQRLGTGSDRNAVLRSRVSRPACLPVRPLRGP